MRTLRCMQGMISGLLLGAGFAAAAVAGSLVAVRLYRGSRPQTASRPAARSAPGSGAGSADD